MKTVKLLVGILGIAGAAAVLVETFLYGTIRGFVGGILSSGLGTMAGAVLAAAFLIGGVLGILFLWDKLIGVISGVLFLIGAAAGFYKMTEYKDAFIWAVALGVLGVAAILASVLQKRENDAVAAK